MSKVTVITDANGAIAAVGLGSLGHKPGQARHQTQAGLFALPGQTLHELDIKDDVSGVKTFSELKEKVRPHLTKSRH